jgi:nicotinamidase-related amidase
MAAEATRLGSADLVPIVEELLLLGELDDLPAHVQNQAGDMGRAWVGPDEPYSRPEAKPMSALLPLPQNARSALAVVDMQVFYFRQPERRKNLDAVIENINRLIGCFEAQHLPIVHVVTWYKADGSDWDLKMKMTGEPVLVENSPEAAILPDIQVSPAHFVVRKTRYSSFFRTDLYDLLQANSIQRLMVVGGYTHYCVNATVFDAYAYDIVPGIVTDAVISHLPDEAAVMVDRMRRNGYHVCQTREYIDGL